MCKLINRIPGSSLLISSLPGSALRMHIESLGLPRDYQQVFSKPCLVNLISKDTHLVLSIYLTSFIVPCYGLSIRADLYEPELALPVGFEF